MKHNKNYWKRLTKQFNEYLGQDTWKSPRILKLEHTGLFPTNEAGRGPNRGEPTLLDFNTRIIEARSIHFDYDSKYNSLRIFYTSTTSSYSSNYFIEYRYKGKTENFIYKERSGDNLPWIIKQLKEENEYLYDIESVIKLLEANGRKVITSFQFSGFISYNDLPHHGSYSIKPTYIKENSKGIEIGWKSVGTYNSLPNVLKISRSRSLSTTGLSDIGIEESGYYDGHYRCEILTSQAKQARSFFKSRFK